LIAAEPDARRAYYNITQAAELLGVSRVSIWRWIRDGRLAASRLGHRTIRIERAALERILAENGSGAVAEDSEHVIQFYESDAFLNDRVAEFVGSSLRRGGAGIVIATAEHRTAIEAGLRASGLELDGAAASERYVALDAGETLAGLMVDGMPDRQRFHESVGRLVAAAGAGARPVRAFGEMVALLASDGQHDAAIRLEELWNELQRSLSFSLLCAYRMRGLGGEALGGLLERVCACHSRVTPAESYAALATDGERQRAVAVLQQKAESLEAALAAERAARAAAEEALRQRDEFLQIAAHELRTPVTSLRGYAQLLLRRLEGGATLDPERLMSALQLMVGQGTKLTSLVGQLLDVARFEAGKLAIETTPTDLAALVAQAVDAARGWSDRHTLSLESCDHLVADVDAIRLEQVLANLLDNAVKYSPAGGPIQVTLRHADSTSAEIAVLDSGLGLPTGQRDRIFERFHQAHHNAHLSGMGMGLHISRQIVELHGGEIWAEAPAGGGARFVVRVPVSRG
jgi:excisionase family DNA binding protein